MVEESAGAKPVIRKRVAVGPREKFTLGWARLETGVCRRLPPVLGQGR